MLRTIGSQLRTDDATALKEIILMVQSKAGGLGEEASSGGIRSVRASVFIQMLTDLKNNKQKQREKEAAEGAQGRLLKWLRQLATSADVAEPSPFNVRWEELLEADTRGRWWLVGSAWAGRTTNGSDTSGSAKNVKVTAEQKLVTLANTQRMNTAVRQRVGTGRVVRSAHCV